MLKSLQLVAVPNTVAIPVTTRAVDFMSQFLYCKFARLKIRLPMWYSVHQLFRITLLQIETKVDFALRKQCSRHIGGRLYQMSEVTLEMVRVVSSLGANLAPMANMINAIGVCKAFGTTYLPRFAAPEYLGIDRVPEPTTVTLSNLRFIVEALANGRTPIWYREYFYEHNAIPGAIWIGERATFRTVIRQVGDGQEEVAERIPDSERFPLLANADVIMPSGYALPQLRDVDSRSSRSGWTKVSKIRPLWSNWLKPEGTHRC